MGPKEILFRIFASLGVALIGIVTILMYLWLPLYLVMLIWGAVVALLALLQRWWIARRRATPVYQPPTGQQLPPAPSYLQGYQPQPPVNPATWTSLTSSDAQPKDERPGAIYEQPLVQYPEQPLPPFQ